MGLIDDKKNIFTTIGAYTSLKQESVLPNTTNLYPSVSNKKDIIPFLLDILKTVVGSEALKQLTGELFTNFIDNVEPQMKTALTKQLTQYNAGDNLNGFTNFINNGYSMPVKNIDVYSKLKTNPNSAHGSLLFNNITDNFDSKAYQAIQNVGTDTVYKNMVINYNSLTDSFIFKPNPASISPTTTVGDWLSDYINNTVIIDKKEFLTKVMNTIYGSVTTNQNKTVEQVYQELQINKLLEQLSNDDDSFEISQNEYDTLLQNAQALVDGIVYYDMGCGMIGASLPLSGMTNLISQISGATTDPFTVGNAVEATIDDSTANVQETATENKQTIKDGFFQKLINTIVQILIQAVTTTPQIRTILGIISGFQNNGNIQLENAKDDLKKFKIFIKCLIQEIKRMINQFIYKLVISFLMALLNPIIKKIIREKTTQYTNIIKSLIT